MSYKLLHGDCLELMKSIPDNSVDLILCSLPYRNNRCKTRNWDKDLPIDKLWTEYNRLLRDGGAICLFNSEPFSSLVRCSNIKHFKYDWIWDKGYVSNPQLIKYQPLKNFEIISVFGRDGKAIKWYPQGLVKRDSRRKFSNSDNNKLFKRNIKGVGSEFTNYPKMLSLKFKRPHVQNHISEKPVDLLEYLIKTYTLEGGVVLDNCMGSGSCGVACVRTGRDFIGMELEEKWYNIAVERVTAADKVNIGLFESENS